MKFEFEIPDEKIQEIVTKQAQQISSGTGAGWSLTAYVEREVELTITNTVIKPAIEKAIKEKSENLINKSIDVKLGGWIKRKVKEFIKEKLS